MPYAQLSEVDTWYAEQGEGDPLVLLHPGAADSRAFEMANLAGLAERYHTYRFDRRGHGRTADVPGPIGYQRMADDTVEFLESVVGGPAYLLGHSDGAPVALLVAAARPDLVRKLVFSSGVYHHQGWLPGVLELDDEVEPAHLHSMHRAMPHAQLAIVPGTGHGLLADKPDLCNRMIIDFLNG